MWSIPACWERLRTEDEKLLIELEKRYFGKLSFRADPALHAEHFKIFNAATNEEIGQCSVLNKPDAASRRSIRPRFGVQTLE